MTGESSISAQSAPPVDEKKTLETPEVTDKPVSLYINPPTMPTQVGPDGILFDFNLGARVVLPPREEGKWRVILRDLDTGNVLFANENTGATVHSSKRYYVRFRLEVDELKVDGTTREVLRHDLDCKGKKVVIQFPVGTLGDTLAWFSYAARFASERKAHVTCILSGLIIPLLKDAYPELTLLSSEEASEKEVLSDSYAMYCMGLFF